MENTVYIHTYKSPYGETLIQAQDTSGGGRFVAKVSNMLVKLAKLTAVSGSLLLAISFAPGVAYNLSDSADKISGLLANTAKNAKPPVVEVQEEVYQPRFDASLPKETTVRIPSIGVETTIHEATVDNYEDALKEGVWRVADFGTPYLRSNPTILVAHRYGYLAWSNLFRRQASFYNLPKLKEGDTIEVTWRQRKYVYAVYGESEGEDIADYSADLILYTCENLNSPVRIFKYARLLEI